MKIITLLKTGGEYTESHVIWLQKQIMEPIYCLTDSTVKMDNVTSIPLLHNFPGWWSKIELFRGDIGTFLYMDLDSVLLDGIPEKWKIDRKYSIVLKSIAGLSSKVINSGLMYVREEHQREIWTNFIKAPEAKMAQYKWQGDQGMINEWLHPNQGKSKLWQDLFPGEIISYKSNYLKDKNLKGVRAVLFHGKPRPWEVEESWVSKIIS